MFRRAGLAALRRSYGRMASSQTPMEDAIRKKVKSYLYSNRTNWDLTQLTV